MEREEQPLRLEIRMLLEKDELIEGTQVELAGKYKVSKARVYTIVRSERKGLANPVHWEAERAKKRGEPYRILYWYMKFKEEGHPAFRQKDSEE